MGAGRNPTGGHCHVLPLSTSITDRLPALPQQLGDDLGPATVEPVEQLLSRYRSPLGSR